MEVPSWLIHVVRSVTCASVFFATIVTLSAILTVIGPTIETRMFPVVSKLTILSAIPGPDPNTTQIEVAFDKLRDCEYIGLSWYHSPRGKPFERVPVMLMRKPSDNSDPNRPLGYQQAGPWVIGVAPSELRTNSFAILSHRCHQWWLSRTEFFP